MVNDCSTILTLISLTLIFIRSLISFFPPSFCSCLLIQIKDGALLQEEQKMDGEKWTEAGNETQSNPELTDAKFHLLLENFRYRQIIKLKEIS